MSDVELTDAEREIASRFESFFGWLMASGDSALWGRRTVGEEFVRVFRDDLVGSARLSQEREQVRADRDQEWRAWHEALLAAFDWTANDLAYKAPEEWPSVASAALRRLDERARLLPPSLAQDGPRPAQEGER